MDEPSDERITELTSGQCEPAINSSCWFSSSDRSRPWNGFCYVHIGSSSLATRSCLIQFHLAV